MSFKVAFVQVASLALLLTAILIVFDFVSDDQINVSVINKTGSEISHSALSYGNQYCSTASLAPNEHLICSFSGGDRNGIEFIGRINDKPYLIKEIEGIESGKSYRNIIDLKPDMKYELSTKQVII